MAGRAWDGEDDHDHKMKESVWLHISEPNSGGVTTPLLRPNCQILRPMIQKVIAMKNRYRNP